MHVYFVRHGETALNLQNVHQSPSTPLSSLGRERTVSVAEHLRGVHPDIIIASEYTRSKETARIIGLHTGVVPQSNYLFNEVMRPSILFGQSHYGIRTLWYIFLSVLHRKDPNWRYADGENLIEVRNRAKRALAFLEPLAGRYGSVIIVSHTVFINIMISHMCENRMPSLWKLLLIFVDIGRMKNTDIIHAEFLEGGPRNTCAWRRVREQGAKHVLPAT